MPDLVAPLGAAIQLTESLSSKFYRILPTKTANTTDIPLWGTSAADVKRNIHLTASSSVTTRQCSSKLVIALAVPSLDGDPHSLTPTLGLNDLLLQAVNPDAAVDDLAYKFV